ncbi:MAG: hypothetical protein ABWZ64_13625 [Xanthobacteraceae bacterium]
MAQGNLSEALQAYQLGLHIREHLDARDPRNAEWREELASTYVSVIALHMKLGDAKEALIQLHKGHEVIAQLITSAPGNPQWQKNLAWFEGQIARLENQEAEKH